MFKVHNLVSPKKHQTWSNDHSERDLSCFCVSLSISQNCNIGYSFVAIEPLLLSSALRYVNVNGILSFINF